MLADSGRGYESVADRRAAMKVTPTVMPDHQLIDAIKQWTGSRAGGRLGLLTSIDGEQLLSLMLDPEEGTVECWESPLETDRYRSTTHLFPQGHWSERAIWDLFGLVPEGHPRLKHLVLHDPYEPGFHPLRRTPLAVPHPEDKNRKYRFLEVRGEGVYEIPVGPIHAGVIEPGHFRFSCFGETILNLEIRLGYVHRGVEKRLTEVPWQKARFVAEAAASDTAVGNALAHAVAMESLLDIQPTPHTQALRTLALEIERLAMHIIDVGGVAMDIGLIGIAGTMGRLRGLALGMAQALSGSRFMRGFIMPGGVHDVKPERLKKVRELCAVLHKELVPVVSMIQQNQNASERMENIGKISQSLAQEFGLVGVAARAAGIAYDCRKHFQHATYPNYSPPVAVDHGGDIASRTRVRLAEIWTSLDVISAVLDDLPGQTRAPIVPPTLPPDSVACGIVEAFRGELIHLVFTDSDGKIRRYAIKDPSFNNFTTVSIAIRNNLIADFPLCNKSLSLSYSGNDL
jgi:Ni,Fe-hydrogenase III large subunit/Ni,Fe-hydrogenase III component G